MQKTKHWLQEIDAAGGHAIALRLDLADDASITTFHDDVIAQVGTAEILVNNAISMFPGHVERYSTEEWERSMQVDGTRFFRITQVFLNDMLAAGRGNIITIASILGMVGPEERLYPTRGIAGFRPNYFFVKAGMTCSTTIVRATRSLRSEWRGGIRLIERGLWYISAAHSAADVEITLETAESVLTEMAAAE